MSNDKMRGALEAIAWFERHGYTGEAGSVKRGYWDDIKAVLTQQPESESVGYISKEYLDALAGETKHLCSTISAEPRHNSSIDYVIPVFTSHRPSAQVPEGWKLEFDGAAYTLHGPENKALRVPTNLAPDAYNGFECRLLSDFFAEMLAAPSVAEKDE